MLPRWTAQLSTQKQMLSPLSLRDTTTSKINQVKQNSNLTGAKKIKNIANMSACLKGIVTFSKNNNQLQYSQINQNSTHSLP
jgi:hypothetical protein